MKRLSEAEVLLPRYIVVIPALLRDNASCVGWLARHFPQLWRNAHVLDCPARCPIRRVAIPLEPRSEPAPAISERPVSSSTSPSSSRADPRHWHSSSRAPSIDPGVAPLTDLGSASPEPTGSIYAREQEQRSSGNKVASPSPYNPQSWGAISPTVHAGRKVSTRRSLLLIKCSESGQKRAWASVL